MREMCAYHVAAKAPHVNLSAKVPTTPQHHSPIPCTLGTNPIDVKRLNNSKRAEIHAFCINYLNTQTQHADPSAKVPTTAQHSPVAPCTIGTPQNDTKLRNERDNTEMSKMYMYHATTPTWHIKPSTTILNTMQDIVERLQVVVKDLKEYKADMASRSVEIRPTLQLTTPSVVLPPPSLAWVPSPPSPAQTPLVLPTILALPTVPPGLNQPLPPLPPTTEYTPPIFNHTPKPKLGPVVHAIVFVPPEKAPPPHPPSPSTTGVVLLSLLLLHYQGSYHWLVIGQPGFSELLGIRPDPEPPPVVHYSTVLRLELDTLLVASSHLFFYFFIFLFFIHFHCYFYFYFKVRL
jgi:hypothetical protein